MEKKEPLLGCGRDMMKGKAFATLSHAELCGSKDRVGLIGSSYRSPALRFSIQFDFSYIEILEEQISGEDPCLADECRGLEICKVK